MPIKAALPIWSTSRLVNSFTGMSVTGPQIQIVKQQRTQSQSRHTGKLCLWSKTRTRVVIDIPALGRLFLPSAGSANPSTTAQRFYCWVQNPASANAKPNMGASVKSSTIAIVKPSVVPVNIVQSDEKGNTYVMVAGKNGKSMIHKRMWP